MPAMRLGLTRRLFTAACLSAPAIAFAKPLRADDVLGRFRALSARLTGVRPEALDPEQAAALRTALIDSGHGATLDELLSGDTGPAVTELERQIIVGWYSGVHPTNEGPVVHTVGDALVWRELGFATAPGFCSEAPGDWSMAPHFPQEG